MCQIASQKTIDLIRNFEGCKLTAYEDNGALSIGYGHRGPGVKEGDTITQSIAETLLTGDVASIEAELDSIIKVKLTEGQFGALVSFAYNLGVGTLERSSLLSKVNSGDLSGASGEFGKWIHINGKVSPGLVRRRQAERDLFVS